MTTAAQYWWGGLAASLIGLRNWLSTQPATFSFAAITTRDIALAALAFVLIWISGAWSIAIGPDHRWKAMYTGATFPVVFTFLVHSAR